MKCDELKRKYSDITGPYYGYNEVNEAIAELKARIQLDDDEMAGFLDLEEECGGGDLRNYIAELMRKLEEKDKDIAYWRKEYDEETKLTDALNAEIESLKASHYAEMVDAGMRERRLKRALWLARGYIMELLQKDSQRIAYICNSEEAKDFMLRKRNRYYDIKEKCRAKAEQYK